MQSNIPRSISFQQICNFLAIGETQSIDTTIQGLIVQCFATSDKLDTTDSIKMSIQNLCGMDFSGKDIEAHLDELSEKGVLLKKGSEFILRLEERRAILERIEKEKDTENTIKKEWEIEVEKDHPDILFDDIWNTLQQYLANSFRQHGLQTVAILSSSESSYTLSHESHNLKLEEYVNSEFSSPTYTDTQRSQAKSCIRNFMSTIGDNQLRSSWISQLANGTFNYYSLTASPEVSEKLRKKLQPLSIFLDTNVCLGILNLHVHAHVEVSRQLVKSIKENKLPFSIYFHERTKTELADTFSYYSKKLLSQATWPRHLSRVLAKNSAISAISGIEAKYHENNADVGLKPQDFIQKHRYLDVELKAQGIEIYRSSANQEMPQSQLMAEYDDFIRHRRPEKSDESIEHDIVVLETVREITSRKQSDSTLNAGALFVTSDYLLFNFDWVNSQSLRIRPCTILPSSLLQILRPYLQPSEDYDRAFAETFALPEFRSIGNGSAKAVSRVAEILANYEDLEEELATQILSNDLFMEGLRRESDPTIIREKVELEIAQQYQSLQKKTEFFEKRLQEEEQKRKEDAAFLEEREKQLKDSFGTERAEWAEKIQLLETNQKSLAASIDEEKEKYRLAREREREEDRKAMEVQKAKDKIEQEKVQKDALEKQEKLEMLLRWAYFAIAVCFACICTISFDHFVARHLSVLTDNTNRYPIEILAGMDLLLILVLIFIPKWRPLITVAVFVTVTVAAITFWVNGRPSH